MIPFSERAKNCGEGEPEYQSPRKSAFSIPHIPGPMTWQLAVCSNIGLEGDPNILWSWIKIRLERGLNASDSSHS